MAEEKSGLAKGLLIGFIAGAVAGAITALLYAPKSGKELRSDIKQKANDLKRDAGKFARHARTTASDLINMGKSRADSAISDLSEQAEQILDDSDKALKDLRAKVSDESDRIRTAFRAGADAYRSDKDRPRTSS